jgi:predicted RNA-binding Zn-ribbon protein involved in translation (DUF1610 family)
MKTRKFRLSENQYRNLCDEYGGYCISCGVEVSGVEPDAREYTCEDCGAEQVYGIEELLVMGLVDIA